VVVGWFRWGEWFRCGGVLNKYVHNKFDKRVDCLCDQHTCLVVEIALEVRLECPFLHTSVPHSGVL